MAWGMCACVRGVLAVSFRGRPAYSIRIETCMKIFLSHASPFKPVVRAMCKYFPAHVDYWLDQDEIYAGTDFPIKIKNAILFESDFFVVFVDASALNSLWVAKEVALALQKEELLERSFVIPLLFSGSLDGLEKIGLTQDRHHILVDEHASAAELKKVAKKLMDAIFAHASVIIESVRMQDRRSMLVDFSQAIEEFANAAGNWCFVLKEELRVLAFNQAAFDCVRDAVARHNEVAEPFIVHLPILRDRLLQSWVRHKGLCLAVQEFTGWIELTVLRDRLLALNKVHNMVNAMAMEGLPDEHELAELESEKMAIVAAAESALRDMTSRAQSIISAFELEM